LVLHFNFSLTGIGFYRELAYAARSVRHGIVVGAKEQPEKELSYAGEVVRSSSALLYELIEFNRKLEAWKLGQDIQQMKSVDICKLNVPNSNKFVAD